jgi:methyl-accepting chemotaxis protein PixJ
VLASLPILTNPKVIAITSTQEKSSLLDKFVNIYQVYDSIAALISRVI